MQATRNWCSAARRRPLPRRIPALDLQSAKQKQTGRRRCEARVTRRTFGIVFFIFIFLFFIHLHLRVSFVAFNVFGIFFPDFLFYFTSHIFAYCAVGSRFSRLFVYMCIFFWGVAHLEGAQQSGKGGKMGKVAEKDESATSRHRGIDWLLRSMQRLRTVSLRKKKSGAHVDCIDWFFVFFFLLWHLVVRAPREAK